MDHENGKITDLEFWRFQADPTGVGEALGYAGASYDDRRWREVCAPVDFETCHPALDTYEGVGWFRGRLVPPIAWSGRRVVLHIAGVNARATVWVDGREIGRCTDPFLPFDFEIQDHLACGVQNVIVLSVDNTRRDGEVPGMQRGWRNYGGLLREVSVEATDRCHLAQVTCVATPEDGRGHLSITVNVVNGRPQAAEVGIVAEVVDADGRSLAELATAPCSVASGNVVSLRLVGDVPDVEPWSPDQPTRYAIHLTLRADGEGIAGKSVQIGFRTIDAHDGKLWLNGAPLFLAGFNRHEDSPDRHMCPDPDLVRRDLQAMKAAGANFVRLCHYPHHPVELDLCDEIGLLAMGEIPLYWWNGLEEGADACGAKLTAAKRQLERMILRDVNHPAVVFWSVSNETQEARPEVAAGNAELVQLAKVLDPTRLAVHVSDAWQRVLALDGPGDDAAAQEPRLFENDDVICVNGYPSAAMLTYTGSGTQPGDYELSAATAFWRERLAALHARYPDRPILVTEFGSVSFHGVVDGPFGGDLHAAIIAHELQGMDAPYVCGATVWCWADHAWPPATFGFCSYLATSPYGVLTQDRRRKAAYWEVRRLFRALRGLGEPAPRHQPPGPSGRELYMVRSDMCAIPEVDLPEGYRIRGLRPDEGGLWTDIWRDADPWAPIEPELFADQFGDDLPALQWRSYIVEDARGLAVATITAWYNRTYKGEDYGQVHWVATRQSHWGRGIGKAMLSHALRQMARWHDKAFLGTQTKRIPAIKLYLDFGFVPDLDHEGATDAWREVSAVLVHPTLETLDL